MALRVKQRRKYYFQGRDYVAGEEVVGVPEKYLRLLTHAKGPLEQVSGSANPTDLPKAAAPPVVDDVAALRAEYETATGRRPFNGWDADQLKDKINTYRRRDMQAE